MPKLCKLKKEKRKNQQGAGCFRCKKCSRTAEEKKVLCKPAVRKSSKV